MAISSSVSLLLVALITTAIAAAGSPSPSPSLTLTPPLPTPRPPPPPLSTTRTPPPPPPPAPSDMKQNQLKNIVDALIGAGDFGGWANVLSSTDPSAFPLTATLLIPSDAATSHYSAASGGGGKSFDPFLIPYHVIPQRLTFSDLRRLSIHTRLPTLLPSKFIVITNNSAANFTLDDSQLTQTDIFTNAAFAVHGINDILNYTVYGGAPPPPAALTRPKPPRKKAPGSPGGPAASVKSGGCASCPCNGVVTILAIVVAVIFVQELIWSVEINQRWHEHIRIVEEWTISYRLAEGNRRS